MSKRSYKSKWHRYSTIAGVLIVAVGGVIMIILGVLALFNVSPPNNMLLVNIILLPAELAFLWSILTIICGILILGIIIKQKPHERDVKILWIIASALLGILGGTLAGLITFGGAIIYLLMYVI